MARARGAPAAPAGNEPAAARTVFGPARPRREGEVAHAAPQTSGAGTAPGETGAGAAGEAGRAAAGWLFPLLAASVAVLGFAGGLTLWLVLERAQTPPAAIERPVADAGDATGTGSDAAAETAGISGESYFEFPPSEIIQLPGDPIAVELKPREASKVRLLDPDAGDTGDAGGRVVYVLQDKLSVLGGEVAGDVLGDSDTYRYSSVDAGAGVLASPAAFPGGNAPAAWPGDDAAGDRPIDDGDSDEGPAGNGSPGDISPGDLALGGPAPGEPINGAPDTAADALDAAAAGTPDMAVLTLDPQRASDAWRARELVLRDTEADSLGALLAGAGFGEEADRVAALLAAEFNVGAIGKEHVVAVRYLTEGREHRRVPVQVSVYQDGAYVGTAARLDEGGYGIGADPWADTDLLAREEKTPVQAAGGAPRLLDAVYNTALRNGVPTDIVGEILFHLARVTDLAQPATPEDSIELLFSARPRTADASFGKVLYIGLRQQRGRVECFVVPVALSPGFSCAGDALGDTAPPPPPSDGGMVVPVKGVMTSRFGMRFHPILKQQRMHTGVDWAAPRGTPVVAAFDGTVDYAGPAGGYGNLISLSHGNGITTRYAHLNRFETGIAKGVPVRAGQRIAYVGTTGRSTGPHLHFEVRKQGTPVDPLNSGIAIASSGGPAAGPGYSAADLAEIKALVERAGFG